MNRIETDVKVGQIVYVNHVAHEIIKIKVTQYLNTLSVLVTDIYYSLGYEDNYVKRETFMTEFEYRNMLIDLVNKLDRDAE